MKKRVSRIILVAIMVLVACAYKQLPAVAKDSIEILSGTSYEFGEKDAYDLNKAQELSIDTTRVRILDDIKNISTKDGMVSYALGSGNLSIIINKDFGEKVYKPDSTKDWHIVKDNTKVVDATKLSAPINTGAIIVQTSKDGQLWIDSYCCTDIYNKLDVINKRTENGEDIGCFYRTTNVQITNGCYYRIIVAYKLERDKEKTQNIFEEKTEKKERVEVYKFYAYDPLVSQSEKLDVSSSYEFGDVYRVDNTNGFQNPVLIKSDDPHIDWTLGHFYVSGYSDVRMDADGPVFLKVPGDKASLWFKLEQELDKCNGQTDIKVEYIDSGSDIYFGTPKIDNFGRGALIVRKTDYQNKKEREIYTNYLEATATVGANTRVDLFEEGDYEVALDYQLHYDQPFVFGTTTIKTLPYRIFFKFKVRNGDISAFLRDVNTNQFITNANVAEHGFYIDVAQSHYLKMSIKREVLTDGLNGLVEDTKFSGVAKEGRAYTDEGIYTVTITNLATNDSIEKTVYVGNRDIMLAHMKTGASISEINEMISCGSYIDEMGNIIAPEPVVEEEIIEDPIEDEEVIENPIEEETDIEQSANEQIDEIMVTPTIEPVKQDNNISNNDIPKQVVEPKNKAPNIFVIIAVIVVIGIGVAVAIKKNMSRTFSMKKEYADMTIKETEHIDEEGITAKKDESKEKAEDSMGCSEEKENTTDIKETAVIDDEKKGDGME